MDENSILFEPFECLLEQEAPNFNDAKTLYSVKRGTRLSVKAVKLYSGELRLQVWNVAKMLGLIPAAYTDIICAAVSDYDIVCLAAGTVVLKDNGGIGLLVKVCFEPKMQEPIEYVPVKEETVLPDSAFEFKMDGTQFADEQKPAEPKNFTVKTAQWYENTSIIMLLCVVLPPLGLVLLWLFGAQTVKRKAIFSVIDIVAVVLILYGVSYGSAALSRAIAGDSYKQTATDFIMAWQENNWEQMYKLSDNKWRKNNGVYDVERYFSSYSVVDSFEISEYYTDGDHNTVCVSIMYLDGVRYRAKITLVRRWFKYYVNISDLYEFLNIYSETIITEQEKQADVAGFSYCYADGDAMIYHYDKNCTAAGETLVRMPERDAIANGCGACGRCAR